jgi:tetratricopeptide (TPR) repeat protein
MGVPSVSQITKMLHEPQSVTDVDVESIAALVQAYPYFTPGHYFEAARLQKQQAFSPAMLTRMQLYMGNWLQFYQYINGPGSPAQSGAVQEQLKESTIPEPSTEQQRIQQHTDEVIVEEEMKTIQDEPLIQPVYTEDYFLHQGVEVSNEIPEVNDLPQQAGKEEDEDKSLMVVMSFSEWLAHFKTKSEKAKEEEKDQKALKTMWQKEKLAAALEEENEEIPEEVFEMAVNSITQEDDLASESLAEIHVKQGKYDKAIDMYRKLSLRNPQKNAYFARKIEEILKEKRS